MGGGADGPGGGHPRVAYLEALVQGHRENGHPDDAHRDKTWICGWALGVGQRLRAPVGCAAGVAR